MGKTLKKNNKKSLKYKKKINKRKRTRKHNGRKKSTNTRKRIGGYGEKRSRDYEEDEDYEEDPENKRPRYYEEDMDTLRIQPPTDLPTPYILSVEGGQVFRKMIVVDLTNYPTLMNGYGNIGYYLSSGLSNAGFASKYSNTWLPIGGSLDIESSATFKDKQRGHLIKMSDFAELNKTKRNDMFEWQFNLLKNYFINKYLPTYYPNNSQAHTFFNELFDINDTSCRSHPGILAKSLLNIPDISTLDEFLVYNTHLMEVYTFIQSYFLFEWQLYISETINGPDSYWSRNESFQQYISSLKINEKLIFDIVLPNDNIWEIEKQELQDKSIQYNDDSVIEFFNKHNANYSKEYMNPSSGLVAFFNELPVKKCSFYCTMAIQSIEYRKRTVTAMNRIKR